MGFPRCLNGICEQIVVYNSLSCCDSVVLWQNNITNIKSRLDSFEKLLNEAAMESEILYRWGDLTINIIFSNNLHFKTGHPTNPNYSGLTPKTIKNPENSITHYSNTLSSKHLDSRESSSSREVREIKKPSIF